MSFSLPKLPKIPWRKDRYEDVPKKQIPENLKSGDTIDVKTENYEGPVTIPESTDTKEKINSITIDPAYTENDSKENKEKEEKENKEKENKKYSVEDVKNALLLDPIGIKLIDKLQKYGFFKQEDLILIAKNMSQEGMKSILKAYAKLLLTIPKAMLRKIQQRMLPGMDPNKPVTDLDFQPHFQKLTETYTGLFGAMSMVWEEEGVKIARDKLLEAIKEEFVKPALKIGIDALNESSDELDKATDKLGNKIEKIIRNSLNAIALGFQSAPVAGNMLTVGRAGLSGAAAAASGISLAANSMEAFFETIDKVTDSNKQNIKKYATFLKNRSKQVKDISSFIENMLDKPFGSVSNTPVVQATLPSATSLNKKGGKRRLRKTKKKHQKKRTKRKTKSK